MATRTTETPGTGFDLRRHGLTVARIDRNPPPAALYEAAVRDGDDRTRIAANGALVAYSGEKTGRSPTDKHLVRDPATDGDVWWGPVNAPLERASFRQNRERALGALDGCDRLYCIDGFAGWDPRYRLKVRIICSRPYHALFMHNMLIRPSREELATFGEPDWVVFNAGSYPADPAVPGVTSTTSVDLHLDAGEITILGTEYAGEMKKGIFTVMNHLMPKRGVLSMHCSATADPDTGRSSLFFGLSGTGKTTLSADPNRLLVGDDEHCWTDRGIFNIEGGCYAKTIDLSEEKEPEIFRALRFGAVLENVVLREDWTVDYADDSITQNTRGSYPIEHIANARIPCVADHPADILFLTCDAFGVLPPVSRLDPDRAMYHFISGYTAKVAGTEVGVDEPQATFSPCFGGPFLVWHPGEYARLLAERIREHGTNVWLVNTGWTSGACGTGRRIDLRHTRAIVDAIHSGALEQARVRRDPVFGFEVVTEVPGVPDDILLPRATWKDGVAYDAKARELAGRFRDNFERYEAEAPPGVAAAGPEAN